jgi:hypothetical protein
MRIAQDKRLLPSTMTWEEWVMFDRSVLHPINRDTLYGVYCRLSRLNWIYRQCSGQLNVITFIRGYVYGSNRCSVFLERNFAWPLVALVYITIMLTAMQVVLGTGELSQSGRFQAASYGFTIFSILALLIGIVVMLVTSLGFSFSVRASCSARHVTWNEELGTRLSWDPNASLTPRR